MALNPKFRLIKTKPSATTTKAKPSASVAGTPAQIVSSASVAATPAETAPKLNWNNQDYVTRFSNEHTTPGLFETYLLNHPGLYDVRERLTQLDPVKNKNLYDAYSAKEQEFAAQTYFDKIYSKEGGYNLEPVKKIEFFDLAKFEEGLLNQAKQSGAQPKEEIITAQPKFETKQQTKADPFQEVLNTYKKSIEKKSASTSPVVSTVSSTTKSKPKGKPQEANSFEKVLNKDRSLQAQAAPVPNASNPPLRGQKTDIRYDRNMRMFVPNIPEVPLLVNAVQHAV